MDALESEPIPLGPPVLPWKLFGAERASAHAAISEALDMGQRHSDKAALEWARRDASLFVEPLPKSRLREAEFPGIPNIGFQGRLYGTWLQRAGAELCVETVTAVLDAGVHPDDARVFRGGSLMWAGDWALDPRRIRIAAHRGADVNKSNVETPSKLTPVRDALAGVRDAMLHFMTGDYESHARFTSASACLRELLLLGARGLDPAPVTDDAPPASFEGDHAETATGLLLQYSTRIDSEPALLEELATLVRVAQESGADIDARTGRHQLPPVLIAGRDYNEWALELLIDLGARTDDAHVMGKGREPASSKSFLEQVHSFTGDDQLVARLRERLMKRAISQAQNDKTARGSEIAARPAPVRRRQVV